MIRFFLSSLLLALALSPLACRAWSGAGHMIIAAAAYRNLPAKEQDRVTEILKAHPEYATWKKAFANSASTLDLPLFIFMKASTWPDEIRGEGGKYNHPHWHYINYPLKPTRFPVEAPDRPDDNILTGIAESEKALQKWGTSAEERAVHLSWLIHLLGDIHQPLHCAELVDKQFPEGDKGGNLFYIKPAKRGISLHSFWDGLLGTRNSKPQALVNDAVEIMADHPSKSLPELKNDKPKGWSLESRSQAVTRAYLEGKLVGSSSHEAAPPLPEGYSTAAKLIAERQAALAACRLAAEIGKCVK